MPGICINEDNAHFYTKRSPEQMTEDEVNKVIDFYAQSGQTKAVMLCTNVQRALFDSAVWQPLWDGYEPDGDENQPFLQWIEDPKEKTLEVPNHGRLWVHNLWLLKERKIDHLKLWLERARKHNIEGWLTMRMNDVHTNDTIESFWHSQLWRERPDLWRREYNNESWWDRAFDYSKPEVREHHLKLVRELLQRYQPDGLELDWIRSIFHFAQGYEDAGCDVLTEFVRQVRKLVDETSKQSGKKIKLGVRLPENPITAKRLGMDGPRWIRENLIDQIVLSQWLSAINFDPPIEIWKDIIGNREVTIAVNFSTSTAPFNRDQLKRPGVRSLNNTIELLRGAALNAYHKGADYVYLFNYCYYESTDPEHLNLILSELGSPETMINRARRCMISFEEISAPGIAESSVLPIRFDEIRGISKYGQTITLCPYIGPAPKVNQSSTVIIGFLKDEQKINPEELTVWLNGKKCKYNPDANMPAEFPEWVAPILGFDIPAGVLHDGRNTIEITSKTQTGTLVWSEIYINAAIA